MFEEFELCVFLLRGRFWELFGDGVEGFPACAFALAFAEGEFVKVGGSAFSHLFVGVGAVYVGGFEFQYFAQSLEWEGVQFGELCFG